MPSGWREGLFQLRGLVVSQGRKSEGFQERFAGLGSIWLLGAGMEVSDLPAGSLSSPLGWAIVVFHGQLFTQGGENVCGV